MQKADPLVLFTSTILNANGQQTPETSALVNPHGLPMELLEARFRVSPETTTSGQYSALTGNAVGVKMDMGEIPIVDADVPVSALGTVRDSYEYNPPKYNESAVEVYPTTYGWRLQHPLFIPPGAVVTPTFSHLGQNAGAVKVDVMYICRMVENYRPDVVRVPWVGTYNARGFDVIGGGAGGGSDRASNLDLFNPFKVPLVISRFGARLSFLKNVSGSTVNELNNFAFEDVGYIRQSLAFVRIRSSRGDDVVRGNEDENGAPLELLAPGSWRVWQIPGNWEMRPGEFYTASLKLLPSDEVFTSSDGAGRVQTSILLAGYREIQRRVIGG